MGSKTAKPRWTATFELPRLTSRAFADLGLWMLTLGIVVGVVFPFMLVVSGVPRDLTMRFWFFGVTLLAGLVLAGANFLLARWVVGMRVHALSRQMRHVADVIADATYSGNWSQCSLEKCQLVVDSEDVLGDVAASFNGLINELDSSRQVQQAMSSHTSTLAKHLELVLFARSALESFMSAGGADAGGIWVVRDGDLEEVAIHRLGTGQVVGRGAVTAAMTASEVAWIAVPDDVLVDAAVLSFRPASVLVMPLTFRSTAIGMLVLAFAVQPARETSRFLESLAGPTGVALNNALAHERFQRLAAVDPLTGAYNRRFGLGRLSEEWARSVRSGSPLGLLTFDLDHFKSVNDTYGHMAGDRVLHDAAATARLVLREGDVLVRTGGEEFLVVLPGAGHEDVQAVGERVRRAIGANMFEIGDTQFRVTVSLGGATFPATMAESAEQLTELADQALYAAKNAGRNQLTMCNAVREARPDRERSQRSSCDSEKMGVNS